MVPHHPPALLAACGDEAKSPTDPGGVAAANPEDLDITAGETLRLDERAIIASPTGDDLSVRIPVEVLDNRAVEAQATVTLRRLDGDIIGTADLTKRLEPGAEVDPLVLQVPFGAIPDGTGESGELGDYIIDYLVVAPRTTLQGRRSLFEAYPKQDISLVAGAELNIDGSSYVRVLAEEPVSGAPLANQPVRIELVSGELTTDLFVGETDAFGVVSAEVEADEAQLGNGELRVTVGSGDSADTLAAPVRVTREERIMLTTDKPLYQPGQRIHLRSLALSRPSLRPAADRPITFEVYDAEGNKVFREEGTTDAFGVASLEVPLANELNQGNWRITATVDDTVTERTVRVERYTLPDYGVTLATDRSYYRPGDTALVDIDAQYFFGQPVAGGTVLVQPYTFDVGFNELTPVETTLDANGLARIEVEIPTFLAGTPLEQGNAFVRLDVTVTDGAEQQETVTRNLTVTARDILMSVIPAASLLPGRTNTFYVLTRSPVGAPIPTANVLTVDGVSFPFETNDLGFSEVLVDIPVDARSLVMELTATDAEERTATQSFSFQPGQTGDAIALVSDGSLYAVGDSVEMEVLTGAAVPRAFLDVVRDGQTLLTDVIDLESGRGEYTLDLSVDLAGPLQLHAYFVTEDAQIVRATRLVYVEGARDLNIEYTTDRDEYRPGEEATLSIRVTDNAGAGVAAAVGLTVVDEAVFALQDMRPGLERVYFELEDELLQPQYNVYGWTMESVLASGELEDVERDTAASVVLAATNVPGFGDVVNSLAPAKARAESLARTWFQTDAQRVQTRMIELSRDGDFDYDTWRSASAMQAIVDELPVYADAWGQRYRLTLLVFGDEGEGEQRAGGLVVATPGPDELWDTADDLSRNFQQYELTWEDWWGDDFDTDDGFFAPPQAGGGMEEDGALDNADPEADFDEGTSESGGGGDAPRVRQYFPETLLVAPDIITDADGDFAITFPVADSITTWRMTGLASSSTGQLGSGTAGLRVFQPFFVDIDFPAELTQNDEVGVPIALFNYLDAPQTVELRVDLDASGDWFTLLSDAEVSVDLAPGEVTVRYFDVRVDRVGTHPFQVTAIGSEESDAVRRVVRVVPDGQENLVGGSDRLSESVTVDITIPEEAIDDASALFVKLYPGLFSQVLEGLDSLLRVPSGCFEQTSSTTYPNVLVLQYLQASDQSSPEIELKATEYIAQGYQRLLSYEVTGGGFEWFGNDPAHRILTAYGLLEFYDMAQVFSVDPAVISRTQDWLLAQQESDGRFRASSDGIHEGATNNFTDSDLRATAYLAYALIESGVTGPQVDQAVAWVREELGSDIDDPYTLGMAANMFLAHDATSADARSLIDRLEATKSTEETEEGPVYFWESGSQSLYYGSGAAMNMESTALILQAYIRAGLYPNTVNGVVGWLIGNKDQFGNFSSTQATILTLRAFIELLESSVEEIDAAVDVFLGDLLVETFEITPETSDLMRQLDLSELTEEGTSQVRLELRGEGQIMYQVVGRYYLPWELVDDPGADETMTIDVAYDRTSLAVDETVEATVTVANVTDARLDMVMLDLGVAPGFEPLLGDFDAYIAEEGGVSRVERSGRQLTVYLYGLDAGESMTLVYRLRATLPVEAETPPAAAWLYYDPDVRTEQDGEPFSVN